MVFLKHNSKGRNVLRIVAHEDPPLAKRFRNWHLVPVFINTAAFAEVPAGEVKEREGKRCGNIVNDGRRRRACRNKRTGAGFPADPMAENCNYKKEN
jgi:hypothetical protein